MRLLAACAHEGAVATVRRAARQGSKRAEYAGKIRTAARDTNGEIADHAKLLTEAERARLLRFDPLRKLGWIMLENQARDIVASILDPDEEHGFGKAGLLAVLNAAASQATSEQQARLRRLRRLVRNEPYRVGTEHLVPNGRIDIAVLSPAFRIFFELKRTGGHETVKEGVYQAIRHSESLRYIARKERVEEYAYIFVAPARMTANAPNVIALACDRLALALSKLKGRRFDHAAFGIFLHGLSRL